jgi:hypothetical protein
MNHIDPMGTTILPMGSEFGDEKEDIFIDDPVADILDAPAGSAEMDDAVNGTNVPETSTQSAEDCQLAQSDCEACPIFEGSQIGQGSGAAIKIKILVVRFEASMHSIAGTRVTSEGLEYFEEDKVEVKLDIGRVLKMGFGGDNVDGFSPVFEFDLGKFKINDLTEIVVGGTIPNPYTGGSHAINYELHIDIIDALKKTRDNVTEKVKDLLYGD